MITDWDALPVMLTPPEAMTVLQIGRTLFYELVRKNRIPHIRLGREIRIPRESLRHWQHSDASHSQIAVAATRTPRPNIEVTPIRRGLKPTGTHGRG